MKEPRRITEDTRRIVEIKVAGKDVYRTWAVGRAGVTAIIPYDEMGQGAYVPWLAVYDEDGMRNRVNAAHLEYIYYECSEYKTHHLRPDNECEIITRELSCKRGHGRHIWSDGCNLAEGEHWNACADNFPVGTKLIIKTKVEICLPKAES